MLRVKRTAQQISRWLCSGGVGTKIKFRTYLPTIVWDMCKSGVCLFLIFILSLVTVEKWHFPLMQWVILLLRIQRCITFTKGPLECVAVLSFTSSTRNINILLHSTSRDNHYKCDNCGKIFIVADKIFTDLFFMQ